jgi:hypothetical protein
MKKWILETFLIISFIFSLITLIVRVIEPELVSKTEYYIADATLIFITSIWYIGLLIQNKKRGK